jgi:hypothetical protein
MVQVNNLSGGKGKQPAKAAATKEPEKEKQVITSKDVGTVPADLIESKVSSSELETKAKGLTLPAYLQGDMPETVNQNQSGYIGFASSQSPKWSQMQVAGLKEGQPFAYINKSYVVADPLCFFMCAGESFQTCIVGKDGKMMYVSRDLETPGPKFGSNETQPHYVCLLIVNINGVLTPIKGDFKGTKAGGLEGAIAAVKAASDPDWIRLSDAHKITAAFPQAWGRVFHTITTKYEVSKSGPNQGNPYFRTLCNSAPSTVTQMQMLVEALQNKEFQEKLDAAYENYCQRLAFFDKWISDNAPKVTG